MSFSGEQIRDMLEEYEADNQIGLRAEVVAEGMYQYTSGYPYLVSAICKILEEKLAECENFADKGVYGHKKGLRRRLELF